MPVIDVNGLPMGYELRGSGDPIVLVAGTGYAGATWAPTLVEPLAKRHTVVTFDHRGTGATPPTAERFSTRLFAADAVALDGPRWGWTRRTSWATRWAAAWPSG